MSLRSQAEQDLSFILEDSVSGFGWAITLTSPDEETSTLTGFSNDIGLVFDPETGVMVSGRRATVALRISSIVEAGLSMPKATSDEATKPWRVSFNDIGGAAHEFAVMQSDPDQALGVLVLTLEAYTP